MKLKIKAFVLVALVAFGGLSTAQSAQAADVTNLISVSTGGNSYTIQITQPDYFNCGTVTDTVTQVTCSIPFQISVLSGTVSNIFLKLTTDSGKAIGSTYGPYNLSTVPISGKYEFSADANHVISPSLAPGSNGYPGTPVKTATTRQAVTMDTVKYKPTETWPGEVTYHDGLILTEGSKPTMLVDYATSATSSAACYNWPVFATALDPTSGAPMTQQNKANATMKVEAWSKSGQLLGQYAIGPSFNPWSSEATTQVLVPVCRTSDQMSQPFEFSITFKLATALYESLLTATYPVTLTSPPPPVVPAPVVAPAPKSIICAKGSALKIVSGKAPKCPSGWKRKG